MNTFKNTVRLCLLAASVLTVALSAASIATATVSPKWRVGTFVPDSVTAGKNARVDIWVENTGSVPLTGNLAITDTFPSGTVAEQPYEYLGTFFGGSCGVTGQTSTCVVNVEGMVPGAEFELPFRIPVEAGASGTLVNRVTVSGGGAAEPFNGEESMTVGLVESFAFKAFTAGILGQNAEPDVQAGSTPGEASSAMRFRAVAATLLDGDVPVERLKDTLVHAPAGMVGNPLATPSRCTSTQLTEASPESPTLSIPNCPQDSQIGVAHIVLEQPGFGSNFVPLYNMVPRPGAPVEFGFSFDAITVGIFAKLRSSDYGIDLMAVKAPSSVAISEIDVSLWRVPADSSHDYVRHLCLENYLGNFRGGVCPTEAPRKAFLRTPTSCTGSPLPWATEVTTYTHPNPSEAVHAETTTPAMTGCERLPFAPSFSLAPGELVPHVPSGVDAILSMPQETDPEGLAESDLRSATVTLPEGVSINPSSADGLQACSDEQLKLGVEGVATCPDASKIGTVTVTTPVFDHALDGSIFLRPQISGDPASGEMFRVALEIRSDDDGIDVKVPAQIKLDPGTGRLTTVIPNSPQLPLSSVALHFKNGPRAPLSTPRGCGTYTTSASFVSWSGKTVNTTSQFTISADGHGAPCAPAGFAPVLKAGTVNNRADASSPFVVRLTRTDGDQPLSTISSLTMPPGLTGDIASVPVRCTDAQAAAAACPAQSRVGNVTVGVGTGPNPFYITDGNAYLTGPYKGAPFGLAFVIHAQAGPFDLGNVVVRAKIEIDPHTAQVNVVSDPLPTIVKGVPVQLRDLRVSIDRPGFMLNPTGCKEMQIAGVATSAEGASAPLSTRFQAAECEKLAFKPRFSVTATGHPTRAAGSGLTVRISYPKGAEANLRAVKVRLPKLLPSRLATLQKACPGSVFEANPAACPAASLVGTATVSTPLLASKLTGPAYFVGHGAAKFPELAFVLQGEGVTVILAGETFIDEKTSITTTTFRSIPDVPVSAFTLSLPQGPHSALAGHRSLCGRKLSMPTILAAQNGMQIKQNTKIAVTGCASRSHGRHRRR